jgi:hypothetical protein
MKLEFSRQILEKYSKYQISWKSVQWEPSSMRKDRAKTKLTVAFRNFANAPKICFIAHIHKWFVAAASRATLHNISS